MQPVISFALTGLFVFTVTGCSKKASPGDCEAIVRHFAEVSARESGLDASANEVAAAVEAAKSDPDARMCTTEIDARKTSCALAARTSDGILECLER